MIEDEEEVAVSYSLLTERPDCDEEINRIRTEKVIKAASQVLISKKMTIMIKIKMKKVH